MKKSLRILALILAVGMGAAACNKEAATNPATEGKNTAASEAEVPETVKPTESPETETPATDTPETEPPVVEPVDYILPNEAEYDWPAANPEADFEFNQETGTVTKYLGTAEVVVIPEKISGVPVTVIGPGTFETNHSVTMVKIPEGVVFLEGNAFYTCDNLEKVSLPSTLQGMDPYSFFALPKLETLTLPASLSYLAANSMGANTGLKEVTFLGDAPFIESEAIWSSTYPTITFRVGKEALEQFQAVFGDTVQADGAVNSLETVSDPADFEVDADGTITDYTGIDVFASVPAEIDGKAVTKVGESAFLGARNLRRISLPEGVQEIGKEAFFGTGLVDISMPSTLLSIGEASFQYTKFTALDLGSGVQSVGAKAFTNTNLTQVAFPVGITTLGEESFAGNSNLSYLIFNGKTVPNVAASAFNGCPIADIDIDVNASRGDAIAFGEAWAAATGQDPTSFYVWRLWHPDMPAFPNLADFVMDENTGLIGKYSGNEENMTMYFNIWNQAGTATYNVVGVGPGAFEGSTVKNFYIPRSDLFTTIGDRAFADSQLEMIDMFDSVTTIGNEAFAGCENLTSFTIPAYVTSIGNGAFSGCTNLKEITIPASVTTLGDQIFSGCANLEKVTFEGKTFSLGKDAFADCEKLASLTLPAEITLGGPLGIDDDKIRFAKETTDEQLAAFSEQMQVPWYSSALRVGEQDSFQAMPDSYTPNAAEDFEFDASTGSITKYIGAGGEVVIPREINGVAVKDIAFLAFSDLTIATVASGTAANETLKSVVVPETVVTIADSAFLQCETLEKFICYGPVELVGIRAFENCYALQEVQFVNGLKEMGIYCFNYCESLAKADFAGKLKALPEGAFVGCAFTELSLEYESIGSIAYKQNAKLTTVHLGENVTAIGAGAFSECSALQKVYFANPDPEVMGPSEMQFPQEATGLQLILPAEVSDEVVQAFVQKMQSSMMPNAETMVVKG